MIGSILSHSLPLSVLLAGFFASIPAWAAPGDFVEDDAVALWHVHGQDGSGFGWAVAELADIDGDGAMEAITGAPWHIERGETTGLLVVLSGRTGEELMRWVGEPGSLLGYSMADAGDVDGDGVHDVIAGAPGGGSGRALVYSGADGSVLLTVDGESAGDFFGSAVATAGDIDGDGLADVLVGAELADIDPMANDDAGRAYLVAGADGSLLQTMIGPEAGGHFGSATAWVGDLDDDGTPDPFVGARSSGMGGEAFVHRGSDGSLLLAVDGGPDSGSFAWFFAAGLGDVSGDGIPDLYVGDFSSSAAAPGSGRIHVFSGEDGSQLFEVPGSGPNQGLGPGRGSGDVDADGVPDIVGGSYLSSDGAEQAGKLTWFSGVDGTLLRDVTSLEAGEQLGFDAVGIGDVDRDGLIDVLASGASGDNVYVIAGVSFEEEGGTEDTGSDTTGGSSTTGGTSTTDTGGGDVAPTTTPMGGNEAGGDSGGSSGTTGSSSTAGAEGDGGDSEGCGCRTSSAPRGLAMLVLLVIGGARRRPARTQRGS